MTRKHFASLARRLSQVRPRWTSNAKREAWLMAVGAVANACQEHNQSFDRDKFLEACGWKEKE